MKRAHVHVVLSLFALLSAVIARATEPIRVFAGGPGIAAEMRSRTAELEKAVGLPIEVSVQSLETIVPALAKGRCDAAGLADLEENLAVGNNLGVKLTPSDVQSVVISEISVKIGLHPENPSSTLSKEQLHNIFLGKTKSWEPINGMKAPIRVVLPRSHATEKIVMEYYIGAPKSPIAEYTVTREGQVRAMKKDPGAIGVFSTKGAVDGFEPKYFKSEAGRRSYIVTLKSPRPEVQKLLDTLKKMPITKRD